MERIRGKTANGYHCKFVTGPVSSLFGLAHGGGLVDQTKKLPQTRPFFSLLVEKIQSNYKMKHLTIVERLVGLKI